MVRSLQSLWLLPLRPLLLPLLCPHQRQLLHQRLRSNRLPLPWWQLRCKPFLRQFLRLLLRLTLSAWW